MPHPGSLYLAHCLASSSFVALEHIDFPCNRMTTVAEESLRIERCDLVTWSQALYVGSDRLTCLMFRRPTPMPYAYFSRGAKPTAFPWMLFDPSCAPLTPNNFWPVTRRRLLNSIWGRSLYRLKRQRGNDAITTP